MRYHRFNQLSFFTVCTITILSLATYAIPASGQTVRVAQRDDAGESASDDPDDTAELTVYPEDQDGDARVEDEGEVLSPAEQAEALERRAGDQDDNDPSNRAFILGMRVQEGDAGRVKVVDVAAASPAFDGGIREGDEIISFDGLKGKTYREWIDGIRKLVTDTPDNEVVTVELLRDGERITVKIQTPEEKADDARMLGPLGQQLTNEESQGGVSPPGVNQPFAPGVVSDNDVFINGGGFFGDVASAGERAMAQIVRLSPQQTAPVNPPNPATQTRQQTAAAAATGARQQTTPMPPGNAAGNAGRIGLAGFQDDANGMVVMVDVGGLSPGSYPVGIEDAGLIMGGGPVRSAQNNPLPNTGDVRSQERTNRLNRPNNNGRATSRPINNPPANVPRTQPRPQQPRQTPGGTGGNQRQSQTQALIPRTILAQVTENSGSGTATPPTGQVQPNSTPATGEVNPNLTPPTGQVNPNLTPPTGEVNPNLTPPTGRVLSPGAPPTGRVLPSGTSPTGQPDPDAVGNDGVVGSGVNDGLGTGLNMSTLAQIGVLTVDQSGTGRLQQVVEGVRVRDVVGQAIVIYAPAAPPQTTVPPNTNVSGTRGGTTPTSTPQYPDGSGPAAVQAGQVPGQTPQQVATNTGPLAGTPVPVAAGIIRLMSDRRPIANSPGATGAAVRPNQSTQPPSSGQPTATPTSPTQRRRQPQ